MMFHMNQNLKVVLAAEPVDLRKSFNGPYAIARSVLGEVPEDGALFVFSNRTRTRIKVMCFDGTGCWVSVKRLEQGTFSWPKGIDKGKISLKPEALALLLDKAIP
jgi:transposase